MPPPLFLFLENPGALCVAERVRGSDPHPHRADAQENHWLPFPIDRAFSSAVVGTAGPVSQPR